jgi:N-acetylglucosaminyldiphosphoundecaprenol N-acetyl-beta-D-mannosaminyltransferase
MSARGNAGTDRSRSRHRVRIGTLWMDAVTFDEALDTIAELVQAGRGGAVFTPNVDHIVMAESNERFRQAYAGANLSLVDGTPVFWASRVLGTPLPEKVSGSDLVVPLARRAAEQGWRVYLLGGAPGVAAEAAERLRLVHGTNVVGHDDAMISLSGNDGERAVIDRIRRARPNLLLVALGAPKQELFTQRVRDAIRPAVAVAIGASLDFVTGRVTRAPRWMSTLGLEWVYRLAQEPRRLWRRYLVQDPKFLWVVARTFLAARRSRTVVLDGPRLTDATLPSSR